MGRCEWSLRLLHDGHADPSGQPSATGTLIDERTGRRTALTPPNCPLAATAMFGGPWLEVECNATTVTPVIALYDLVHHARTSVTVDQTACETQDVLNGGCQAVGVGRRWLEFELTCYHCANSYALQPIPSGTMIHPAQVTPGARRAFDLNARSGVQTLCSPLAYPNPEYTLADGTPSHEPGFIQPIAPFALAAAAPPVAGSTDGAFLEHCGTKSHIRISTQPAAAVIATTRDVGWWTPTAIEGIRLPSLKRFRIPTPAAVSSGFPWPPIALSATSVYVVSRGGLWSASLP